MTPFRLTVHRAGVSGAGSATQSPANPSTLWPPRCRSVQAAIDFSLD